MIENTKFSMRALFIDTIQKEVRSKTLVTLFVLSTIGMYFAYQALKAIGGSMDANDGGASISMLGNVSFNAMFWVNNFISMLVATILGSSAFRSDFKEKISYTLLTLPISRIEYFYTRVFGVWVMSMAYYLYTFILGSIFLSLLNKALSFSWHYFLVLLFSGLVLLVVLNIASFVALYFNQLMAIFTSLVIFVFMSSAWSTFTSMSRKELLASIGFFDGIKAIFYFLLPHVDLYKDLNSAMLMNEQKFIVFSQYNWLFEIPHLVLSSIFLFYITKYFIEKKDF